MFTTSTLRRAWRSLWQLRARHDVALAARLALVSLLALSGALGLMLFAAVFGTIDRPGWWWPSLLPLMGICLCVLHGMFGVRQQKTRTVLKTCGF
ncbi:hypothetical protein [Pseudoduganella armeniaca]|uniref:Uncharacterized protein n=1 Tax=Pseudoduganella armeniaca TaxID=2072590 RepID=A0A2R4C6F1_9BURK|nr:hypothetical protein [Pseudoduganella armeniaca]AVR95118.1 hypothetical protein C9I28_04810 [Pseudoduganella armeniaca]